MTLDETLFLVTWFSIGFAIVYVASILVNAGII